MNLYKLFGLNEGSQSLPNVDKERYGERKGLEGPIRLRSGKVVYYDAKEGSYYDPDTDMYLDYDDYQTHDQKDFKHKLKDSKLFDAEGNVSNMTQKAERILSQIHQQYPQASSDMEALLLAYEKGQKQDRIDIERLGWENDQEEADIARHEKQLNKITTNEAESPRDKAIAAAMANLRKQFPDMDTGKVKYAKPSAEELAKRRKEQEQKAMAKAKENADMLMKLADKHGENISASEVGYFAKGLADGKSGYIDRKASDAYGPNVYAYDAGVRVGEKLAVSESESPRVIGATPAQMADPKNQAVMKQAAARDALERGNDGTYNPSTAGVVKSAGKPGRPMFGAGILKKTSEAIDDSPEHRELARLGRVLMDLGKDIDDRDTSEAMGRVGMELTAFGKPEGANSMRALERRSGQPQEVIYKMLAMAQKVQGDPAVGADVPDEDIDENTDDAFFNQQGGMDIVKGLKKPSSPLIKNPNWGQPGHEPTLGTTPVQMPKIKAVPDIPKAKLEPSNITHNITKGSPPKVVPTRKGADPLKIFNPKTPPAPTPAPTPAPAPAPKKQDDLTFGQAFRAARNAHGGPGGAFMWRGKKYQTNVKGEKYVKNPVLVQSKQYEDKSWSEVNKELGDKYGDDVGMNWNPKAPSLSGAAHTTYKYLTQPRSGDKSGQMKRNEVTESDWEENFIKRLKAKISGSPEVQAYLDLKAKQYGDQNLDLDPGAAEKGLGIGVLDTAKARKKAKEKGVRAPGSLRASPNTRDPKRLPEAESQLVRATISNNLRDSANQLERLAKEYGVEYSRQGRTVTLTGDKTNVRRIFYKMAYDPANHPKMTPVNEAKDDIKIGDTVQTLKMGQMQGTVTGFSKKGGIDKVMFKHENGKTYAAVPENLKVISSKKSESLDDTVVEAPFQTSTTIPAGKPMAGYKFTSGQGIKGGNVVIQNPQGQTVARSTSPPGLGGVTQYDHFVDNPKGKAGTTTTNVSGGGYQAMQKVHNTKTGQPISRTAGTVDLTGNTPSRYKINGKNAIRTQSYESDFESIEEAKKKPVPTKPDKWAYAKAQAKKKFDVYPSAYANAWAAKKYKELGGGWRMGNPKKK